MRERQREDERDRKKNAQTDTNTHSHESDGGENEEDDCAGSCDFLLAARTVCSMCHVFPQLIVNVTFST